MVGDEEELQYDHIQRLSYMNMVIKESMRLYPTAPSTFRKLDRVSNIGGYDIPRNTIVMVGNLECLDLRKIACESMYFLFEMIQKKNMKWAKSSKYKRRGFN